jgi:hypothetical protein
MPRVENNKPSNSWRPGNTNGRTVGLAQKYACTYGTERNMSAVGHVPNKARIDLLQEWLLVRTEAS